MAASDRSRAGLIAVSAACVSMLLSNSCADFARTNPFDPAVPVTLTLSGPDSTFAQFDTVRFTVSTDPAYDHDPPNWQLTGLDRLDDNGTYRVREIWVYGANQVHVPVTVKIGPRTATKVLNVTFRPKSLRVRSCADDSREVAFTAFGSDVAFCMTALDARGGIIAKNADVPPYALTTRVIDTNVVRRPSPGYLVAAGNGTSLVVFTFGPVSDTMTVTVAQKARWLTISAPISVCNGPPLPVGQSVQFTVGAPGEDANRNPLADQSLAQREGQDMRWQLTWYDSTKPPPVSITPLGLLKAMAPGYAWVTTSSSTNPTGIQALSCFVEVN